MAGQLDDGNSLPTATLVLLFVPFVIGYAIAPLAKGVQRGNELGWWYLQVPSRSVYENKLTWVPKDRWVRSDKSAGNAYDWLRRNDPASGVFAAKIRAEFTMHNALSVAFGAITVTACFSHEWGWAILSFLAVPLMAWRGAKTEGTFQNTTRKLYDASLDTEDLPKEARLIWLTHKSGPDHSGLYENDEGWLTRKEPENLRNESVELVVEPTESMDKANSHLRLSARLFGVLEEWRSPVKTTKRKSKAKLLILCLHQQTRSQGFEFRLYHSLLKRRAVGPFDRRLLNSLVSCN